MQHPPHCLCHSLTSNCNDTMSKEEDGQGAWKRKHMMYPVKCSDLAIWPCLHFTVTSVKKGSFHSRKGSYLAIPDGTRQWLLFSDAIMDAKGQQWTSLLHNDPNWLDGIQVYPLIWLQFPLSHTTKSHSISYLAFQFFLLNEHQMQHITWEWVTMISWM